MLDSLKKILMSSPGVCLITFEDTGEYRIRATASCGHKNDRYLKEEPSGEEADLITKDINDNKCNICQKKCEQ